MELEAIIVKFEEHNLILFLFTTSLIWVWGEEGLLRLGSRIQMDLLKSN